MYKIKSKQNIAMILVLKKATKHKCIYRIK